MIEKTEISYCMDELVEDLREEATEEKPDARKNECQSDDSD